MQHNFLEKLRSQIEERLIKKKESNDLRERIANARIPYHFADLFSNKNKAIEAKMIAEIKFATPLKGKLQDPSQGLAIAEDYLKNGAIALSVITEPLHFNGSVEFLSQVRSQFPKARLLMKGFVLDSYQLLEALVFGADAVLLIAAFLSSSELSRLYLEATALGLTPLVEVHTEEELERAEALKATLIGVNSRNLKTLEMDQNCQRRLIQRRKTETPFLALSGLRRGAQIRELQALGYQGFLIGSHLMESGHPGKALAQLLTEFCNETH